MISGVLIGAATVLAALGYTQNFNPAITAISTAVAIALVLRTIFWLPFVRHEKQEEIRKQQTKAFEEKLAPQFTISCSDKIAGCKRVVPKDNLCFFRVRVETDCPTGIKNCKGHLIKVELGGSVVFDIETLILPFSPSESPDARAKTIHQKTPEYLDVLAISTHSNVVISMSDRHSLCGAQGLLVFGVNGEYILSLSLGGDGVPAKHFKLKFIKGLSHVDSTMELLSQ